MHATTINKMARLSGNTMINIKSRMNLSVNKRRYMTHDMNSFVVYFLLFLLTFQQYSTIKTADARKKKEKKTQIRVPDGIWPHDPPWSSRMLYHWATEDSVVSKGQIVGNDWNHITWVHSHVLAHMNSLTASRCHFKPSHMNSLRASRHHIKAYRDASNQPPKWVY